MPKRFLIAARSPLAWIARHELWPTGVGVLLATISLRFAPWGLALLAVLWLIRRLGAGHWSVSTPVDWPAGILVVMGGVSWLVTVDRAATGLALSRLLAGLALMYGIVNWAKTGARLLLILWGGTLCALLLALATPMIIPWQGARYIPAVATRIPHLGNLLNANMVAGALVMLLPFPLAGSVLLLRFKRGQRPARARWGRSLTVSVVRFLQLWRVSSIPITALVFGALFFTQSRGAWLAAGGGGFVVGVGCTLLFLGALAAPVLAWGWLVWQGQLTSFLDALGTGGGIAGWDERVEIWSRALYMIQDFPFTGIGADMYPQVVNVLYPLFLISPTTIIPHAHNLFLQVGIDLGLPGLIAFLAILIGVCFSALRSLREQRGDPVRRTAIWVGMASLAAMLIHGLVDATTWIAGWAAPLPWLVFGMLLAAARYAAAPPTTSEDQS